HVLEKDDRLYPALHLMAAVNRTQARYDDAIANCNTILEMNKEDVNAISQKAKIELKKKHDKEAAEYAEKEYTLSNKNVSALEVKIVVAWFAGKRESASQLLEQIKNEETDGEKVVCNRTLDVVNGKEIYR